MLKRRDLKPGISPRRQLEEVNIGLKGRNKFSYLPHYGAKQKSKDARRLAKLAARRKEKFHET